ncbi:barstar family protein [Paenibacillus profundus]|uniref:Barstar family protein n=1 Tax=Paenibacillus profundus TaxID=1173085 RepID=A0ABS8YPL1_9BACL|nr:barstar family protein [Paenibacillus profundus]MCE5173741.1 barstar family protein [Paenibacillus profundus]
MDFKFSLLDDKSDLVIGYCKDIIGLDGEVYADGDSSYHKISLIEFVFCNDFKKYLLKNKESINRLVYVSIINKAQNILGKYPFFIFDETYYHKVGFPECPTNIELKGSLQNILSNAELEIWDKWRISYPTNKNEWSFLNEDDRRAWLNVVTKYQVSKLEYEENKENMIYLDGTYITDYSSFFCALGEAINGPGGYYGHDFSSLIDCLNGGFGATSPFIIMWGNYKIAEKKLDTHAWLKEVKYRRKRDVKLFAGSDFEELGDRPLFQALVENINSQGVKILFE